MISLQTNVDSLIAQNNLSVNNEFQSNTIQQLTSGYRINKAGDDAAGLAVANQYQSTISQLTQGVNNANNGLSQLQIVDGGISNIETILNRMQTLATESASGTFTGNRNTLNQEYQSLVNEITRQASNIGLNAGGSFNQNMNVFIGGANSTVNAAVNINLSGASNALDATSLGLQGTSVVGGSGGLSGNNLNLNAQTQTFVQGSTNEVFTFNYINSSGTAASATATLTASSNGYTLTQALASINQQLTGTGITAGVDSNGHLQFTSAGTFTVKDSNITSAVTNALTSYGATPPTGAGYGFNNANYSATTAVNPGITAGQETLVFTTAAGAQVSVALTSANGNNAANAVAALNTALNSYGINAVVNANGTGISIQSANSFTVTDATNGTFAGTGLFGATGANQAATSQTVTAPTSSGSGTAAMAAITAAINQIGTVQGIVGAGENTLQYAINLANSQIDNLSKAESAIKDADVAKAAANLTKSQVLVQTSIAALAQANAEPQAVLKLLQG